MLKTFPITNSALHWLELIISERFGHEWDLQRVEQNFILKLKGMEGAIVFDSLEECFTLPRLDLPCIRWDADAEGWWSVLGGPLPAPGVAHLPAPLIELCGADHIIHYDILGLTYWMLARVEEIGRTDLDNHDRFPAIASHAFRHGYLDRPVVDEWLHILGQVILLQWSGVELKRHEFKMRVSHDVDRPFQYLFVPGKSIARQIAGDIVKRKSVMLGWQRYRNWMAVRGGDLQRDPFNTFDWIMDQSERHGLRSAFYFLCGRTNLAMDADYDVEHPKIRDLLRRIHERGHEIGIHPSYETYRKPGLIKREFERLKRVCDEEGIHQDDWGGRMHYLRWEQPTTMRAWNDAGLTYDSSLYYAAHAGFRCGTCHEYTMYDPTDQTILFLTQRPLILMECSVVEPIYMGLGLGKEAIEYSRRLIDYCQKAQGQFTILWHNSSFETSEHYEFFQNALGWRGAPDND